MHEHAQIGVTIRLQVRDLNLHKALNRQVACDARTFTYGMGGIKNFKILKNKTTIYTTDEVNFACC